MDARARRTHDDARADLEQNSRTTHAMDQRYSSNGSAASRHADQVSSAVPCSRHLQTTSQNLGALSNPPALEFARGPTETPSRAYQGTFRPPYRNLISALIWSKLALTRRRDARYCKRIHEIRKFKVLSNASVGEHVTLFAGKRAASAREAGVANQLC